MGKTISIAAQEESSITKIVPGEGVLRAESEFTYREYTYARLMKDDFSNYIKKGEVIPPGSKYDQQELMNKIMKKNESRHKSVAIGKD